MYKRTAAYRADYQASKKWQRFMADCVMTNLDSDAAYAAQLKEQLSHLRFSREFEVVAVYMRNDIMAIHVSNRSRIDAICFTKDLSARMIRRIDSQVNALSNIAKSAVAIGQSTHCEASH